MPFLYFLSHLDLFSPSPLFPSSFFPSLSLFFATHFSITFLSLPQSSHLLISFPSFPSRPPFPPSSIPQFFSFPSILFLNSFLSSFPFPTFPLFPSIFPSRLHLIPTYLPIFSSILFSLSSLPHFLFFYTSFPSVCSPLSFPYSFPPFHFPLASLLYPLFAYFPFSITYFFLPLLPFLLPFLSLYLC